MEMILLDSSSHILNDIVEEPNASGSRKYFIIILKFGFINN